MSTSVGPLGGFFGISQTQMQLPGLKPLCYPWPHKQDILENTLVELYAGWGSHGWGQGGQESQIHHSGESERGCQGESQGDPPDQCGMK